VAETIVGYLIPLQGVPDGGLFRVVLPLITMTIIDLTIWSGQHDTAQFLNRDNAQLSTISLFLK
jgi:hypothetical protein